MDSINHIESLAIIYTIDQGEFKVLLVRKSDDPYKGYWTLPGKKVLTNKTTLETAEEAVDEILGFDEIDLEQFYTFSDIDRDIDKRLIAVSYIGLIDSVSATFKREERENVETNWFAIDKIPKMAYDHGEVIEKSIIYLRQKIVNSNVLKTLFPSDFTLPELQKVYEVILDKELDRRNFRKKFINLGLIEDTGYKNEGTFGRPAKLYRFKSDIEDRNLF